MAANVAQADGFAAAVVVACAIAVAGTLVAFFYALKRRALARELAAEGTNTKTAAPEEAAGI